MKASRQKRTGSAALAFLVFSLAGCKGRTMDPLVDSYERLSRVPQRTWDTLARKKIFFGHQSVGQNIIQGLEAVLKAFPQIGLTIKEFQELDSLGGPMLAHARIGRNRDPRGKIDHFRSLLEAGVGRSADVAFFKFCYVDIDRGTDIAGLLDEYDRTLRELKAKFPHLILLPVTVPLTNVAPGLKAWIKRRLGMEPAVKPDNIKRNAANDRLRSSYGPLVWDLAGAEATEIGGMRVTFKDRQRAYELLNPDFTMDGGHLNEIGAQVVAIDLLLRLAAIFGD